MVMSGKMQDGMNISFNKSLVTNELPSGDALKVRLGNWLLDNPVIPASGTFGYGREYEQFYPLSKLGGISVKGTTPSIVSARFHLKGQHLNRVSATPLRELQNVRRA